MNKERPLSDSHPGVERDWVDRWTADAIRNSGQALATLCQVDERKTPAGIAGALNAAENYARAVLDCTSKAREGLRL